MLGAGAARMRGHAADAASPASAQAPPRSDAPSADGSPKKAGYLSEARR
jgi:hypothetical protein